MTNIAMERSTIFKKGKSSISMGHLYHGYVSHNQRVEITCPFIVDNTDVIVTIVIIISVVIIVIIMMIIDNHNDDHHHEKK